MIKLLINTLLFYTIIINNALSLFNEPKTYEKLYTYFGYSYQSMTANSIGYKQQNNDLSFGVGYNIYNKYNSTFDSFVGLQLEARLPVSPLFGKQNSSKFANFLSLDMIFGAKFKLNNEIALQPFFLFGFNVNYLKYYTSQTIKETIFNQAQYDADMKTYNADYAQYQEDIANYNNLYQTYQNDLSQWLADENTAHDNLPLSDYDAWRATHPKPTFNETEPVAPTEPNRNDIKYQQETGREIQSHNNTKEAKIGLDIGFGLDVLLYDKFIIGMNYKYATLPTGVGVKIHSFNMKFGIMFNI